MAECRECDRGIPDGSNFCPSCGAPQNEEAAKALQSFTKERLAEMSPAEREQLLEEETIHPGESPLERRVSYAVGWVTVVAGIAMLPSIASLFVVLAGILILPPIRRLLTAKVADSLDRTAVLAGYGLCVLLGIGLFWLT